MLSVRILSYGDNNLGAEIFIICDCLQSSHNDLLHNEGNCQCTQQARYVITINNFDFVNNKSDLIRGECDFFLLCFQLLYCSSIIPTCDLLNNIS